jgi:hypothetical protein
MRERYRVYIAGPISGHADLNEPAFRSAAERIAARMGYETVVPHDLYSPAPGECSCLTWCKAMLACLDALTASDAVYFIEGWHLSPGARRELAEANRLGKRLIFE